ncbi:MAG: mechanosensitive ion channel family protein [Anaerolineae bacterium]|nr:mechanosensitive ion channel family protein [Anaerolineae bacterium]
MLQAEAEHVGSILRLYVLPILAFYLAAYGVQRISRTIARSLRPLGDWAMSGNPRRVERQRTLQALIASAISIAAYITATLFSLSLFVSLDSLIWVVGLFSAAFGLGARPFISDYLTGITFIFEDSFDVGDKIEIPASPKSVEGVVEAVTLRTTRIRGMDGELYTIPNGDIRLMRNFSRGSYSMTTVTLTIPAPELKQTLTRLEDLGNEAMALLPNLLEPWQVISKSGELGERAELTILAKARFGKGAVLRTNLLTLLQERLSDAAVEPDAAPGE